MRQTKINPLLLIGVIGVFTVGTPFAINMYRAFGGNQDIYWTARTMPLTIDKTKNSFELFINKKCLNMIWLSHLSKDKIKFNCRLF